MDHAAYKNAYFACWSCHMKMLAQILLYSPVNHGSLAMPLYIIASYKELINHWIKIIAMSAIVS